MGKSTRRVIGPALAFALATAPAGTVLELEKPAGPGAVQFTVLLRSAITLSPLKGYSLNLFSPQSAVIETLSADTLNRLEVQFPFTLNDEDKPQANLVFNVGESEFFNSDGLPPGATVDLLSFTFEVDKTEASVGPVEIFVHIGASGWDDGVPDPEQATFGPNPPFVSDTDPPDFTIPLIVVNNVGPPDLLGDINGDGFVNADDIDPFADVLLGAPQAPEHVERSDLNGNGVADGLDIAPFVEALAGG